jgi:hypothetical protein
MSESITEYILRGQFCNVEAAPPNSTSSQRYIRLTVTSVLSVTAAGGEALADATFKPWRAAMVMTLLTC